MAEEQTPKTRYEEIKDNLLGGGKEQAEIEQIQVDVPSKEMLKIYEKNANLFLDRLGKHLDEFEGLLIEFENYRKMMIVQKALMVLDAYEPLILNLQQEKEFLFSKLKTIAENVKKEIAEVKAEAKENQKIQKEDKLIEDIMILHQKGKSLRRISEVVGLPYSKVRSMIMEKTGGDILEETEEE